jgi:hypothetical protein
MLAAVPARRLTCCLVVLAATLAGCGSSNKKSDFVARADAICVNAVRAVRSITPPATVGSGPQRLRALALYLGKLAPVVQSEASQIRALKRPSGSAAERAALDRYVGALARFASDYKQLAAAANRGDAAAVASGEAALRASPVAALATAYGLRSCGNAGTTAV